MMQAQYGYGTQPVMYGPAILRPEVPLLAEPGIQVTSARFVVYQQTYPIGGITTIAPFSIPAKNGMPIFFGLFALLVALMSFSEGSVGGVVTGVLLGVLACIWFSQCKATHGVYITTAGMNVRALMSNDIGLIHRVVAALNHAVAMR